MGSFTIKHFEEWASRLILDNGEPWRVEPFQRAFIADLFKGYREAWLVVPEGNGKTTLVAGLGLYYLEHQGFAKIPVAASSREQARVIYEQAEGFVTRTPRLHERLPDPLRELRGKQAKDVPRFFCLQGLKQVKYFEGGEMVVFAADDRTGDGVIPSLAILDELHRHRDLRLYRTWRGKLEKRDGQIVAISTAGEPGSEFEDTRAEILKAATKVTTKGCHVRAADEDLVLHDWAVRKREDASDMRVVAQANPRRDITAAVLERKRASKTMTDAHWARFVCNIATRESGQAIESEQWDGLAEPGLEPDRSRPAYGWLDLGWKIDTTALGVVVWESPERRVVAGVTVLEPPVDEADIVRALLDVQEEFGPVGWVYDPNAGGQQMVQLLGKGEHPQQHGEPLEFIEHSQDNAPMALAASRFDEAVRSGWIVHDGDRALRAHVLNGVRKDLGGEKWKFDRPSDAKGRKRSRYPIDALTGVAMGHSVAVVEEGEGRSVYEDRGMLLL